MSLMRVYVEQILRPSFLPNYMPPSRRTSQPEADAKRREVLHCLQLAGKAVSRTWVADYTGYTKQSANYLLNALVETGKARRVEGGAVLLWEVV